MRIPYCKPLVAVSSALCIAVPLCTPPALMAAEFNVGTVGVVQTATQHSDRPVRLLVESKDFADAQAMVAAAAATDPTQFALQILTFPLHNVLGVGAAVGSAVNSVIQVGLLPFAIASFLLVNQPEKIPAFIATTQKNLANAIPGIFTAIANEIQYDVSLFSGGGGTMLTANTALVAPAAAAAAATDPTQLALQILTFPLHNVLGVGAAVGSAVNSVIQLGLLPFAIASLLLVNQPEKIPAFIETTQKNLANAIPGIFTAIANEYQYDVNLFAQLGAGLGGASTLSLDTASLDAGDPVVKDGGVSQLGARSAFVNPNPTPSQDEQGVEPTSGGTTTGVVSDPTGTPSTGTPSTGTPSTGTPSTGTPSTGTPSTGTPSTGTPSTGTPSTGTPSTGTPTTGTPSTGTPTTGTPSTGTPSTGTPSTGTPSTGTTTGTTGTGVGSSPGSKPDDKPGDSSGSGANNGTGAGTENHEK